jgi:hypothetical protein
MQYGRLPGIDKPISRLVQGTVPLDPDDLDASFALLDAVHELGCNAFDTAHVYGNGDRERMLGRWIRERGLREKVIILTKGAHHNADRRRVTPFDITSDLHDSLARLQVDAIDLYVLHRDDPEVAVGPIVEVLNEHRKAGLIDAFGGSNWTHERIRAANVYAEAHGLTPFVVSSPQFSLAEMVEPPWTGCISIGGPSGLVHMVQPGRGVFLRALYPGQSGCLPGLPGAAVRRLLLLRGQLPAARPRRRAGRGEGPDATPSGAGLCPEPAVECLCPGGE